MWIGPVDSARLVCPASFNFRSGVNGMDSWKHSGSATVSRLAFSGTWCEWPLDTLWGRYLMCDDVPVVLDQI